MRNSKDVFHLAIPCKDVGETVEIYEPIMVCKLSRQYDERATFNFFGDQLVCHLSPDNVDNDPNPSHLTLPLPSLTMDSTDATHDAQVIPVTRIVKSSILYLDMN